jgi:hypothetical protein
MKKIYLIFTVLSCCLGCNKAVPTICDTVPPNLPVTTPAETKKDTPVEIQKVKSHYSYPSCPSNMRLVFRSVRELKRLGYKSGDDDGYDVEDDLDIEYKNSFCVSDWMDLSKEKP